MFLFLKLVLAHLIADFVLQFEELYQLKVRSLWGHISHVLIHGIVSLILLIPYLNVPFILFFVGGMVLMHLTQDFIKYTLTKKIPKNTFFYFTADQVVHILVLSTILLFPVSAETRGFPGYTFWDWFYRSQTVTLSGIFFILLTFGGSYTIHAFYRSYVKDARPKHGITSFELTYTILERSMVSLIVLFGANPWGVLLIPALGLARLPLPLMRNLRDFLVSVLYAVILSLLFRGFF